MTPLDQGNANGLAATFVSSDQKLQMTVTGAAVQLLCAEELEAVSTEETANAGQSNSEGQAMMVPQDKLVIEQSELKDQEAMPTRDTALVKQVKRVPLSKIEFSSPLPFVRDPQTFTGHLDSPLFHQTPPEVRIRIYHFIHVDMAQRSRNRNQRGQAMIKWGPPMSKVLTDYLGMFHSCALFRHELVYELLKKSCTRIGDVRAAVKLAVNYQFGNALHAIGTLQIDGTRLAALHKRQPRPDVDDLIERCTGLKVVYFSLFTEWNSWPALYRLDSSYSKSPWLHGLTRSKSLQIINIRACGCARYWTEDDERTRMIGLHSIRRMLLDDFAKAGREIVTVEFKHTCRVQPFRRKPLLQCGLGIKFS